MSDFLGLKAIFINCTLKKTPRQSHTRGLMDLSKRIMENEGLAVEVIRLVDYDVAPGVQPDMTKEGFEKDAWPELSEKLLNADILLIGTPIWLGQISSQAKLLIERIYSLSGKTNDKGQYLFYGKVGGCIITGNEDGVKHCAQEILYSLQHVGYTIPPQADSGWIGPIGPGPSYLDKESNAKDSEFTNKNTTFLSYNLMHLAKMLKKNGGIPAKGNSAEAWGEGKRWAFENPEYR